MEPRKTLLLLAAMCGVCGLLVVAAASLGSDRPEAQFMAAAPSSSLEADYSVDEGVRRSGAVRPEIVEATARDTVDLGLPVGAVGDGVVGPGLGSAVEIEAGSGGETSAGLDGGEQGASSSSDPARTPAFSKSPLPLLPTAIAMLLVGAVCCGAYLLLKPAGD